jgi:hypothetical protein
LIFLTVELLCVTNLSNECGPWAITWFTSLSSHLSDLFIILRKCYYYRNFKSMWKFHFPFRKDNGLIQTMCNLSVHIYLKSLACTGQQN